MLTAGAIALIDRYGKSCRIIGPTGTVQVQNIDKRLVDSPLEAYQIWKQAGYQGRTIVFVSGRWESFSPGELIPVQMFRSYPLQLFNTAKLLEDEHLNGVTFLYVASFNKIIRKIVSIVPEGEFVRMKGVARVAKDHMVSNKQVYVSREGYPRWFTTGENFAGGGEPALVYIGASYFKTAEPEDLYRQLVSSGLQSDCVILCNETGKESVTSEEIAKLNKFARLIGITASSAEVQGMIHSKPQTPQHTTSTS
jgi:hypothetical protein